MANNRPNNRGGIPLDATRRYVCFDFLFSLSSPPFLSSSKISQKKSRIRGFNFNSPLLDKATEFTSSTYLRAFIQGFYITRYCALHSAQNGNRNRNRSTHRRFLPTNRPSTLPSFPHLLSLMDRVCNNESRPEPRGRGSRRERNEELGSQLA